MFNSTKLRQIVTIDRAGSLSAASKILHVSQSTLTKAVADVEQDLGVSLFLRTAKGVIATPQGREFLSRAERIVADFDMLIEDTLAQRDDLETVLRIGIAPASLEGLYNRLIATLLRDHPKLRLTMAALPVERGIRLLRRGDLDLLFAPADDLATVPDVTTEIVRVLNARLFCRKDHPLTHVKSAIQHADIIQHRVIVPDLTSFYAKRLIEFFSLGEADPRKRMIIIENFSIVSETVRSTDLLAVVSEDFAHTRKFKADFTLVPVDLFEPLSIGVARQSKWIPSKAVRSCLNLCRSWSIQKDIQKLDI